MSASRHVMLWMGICCLYSYNCLLQAIQYFSNVLFPGKEFAFTSMLAYSLPLVAGQITLAFWGNSYTVGARIFLALVMMTVTNICFLGIAVTGLGYDVLYMSCLVLCAILGLANALLQATIFGLAGVMGADLSHAVMLGIGLSGIICLGLSLAMSGIEPRFRTAVMFACSTCFALLSFWVFFHGKDGSLGRAISQLERPKSQPVIDAGSRDGNETATPADRARADIDSFEVQTSCTTSDSEDGGSMSVLSEVMPQAMNVVIIYAMTMMVFPGVVSKWLPGPSSMFIGNQDLFTTINIGIFQVLDTVSRQPAGWSVKYVNGERLWIYCWLRLLLVPLFMLAQRSPESVIWGSDAGRFLLCSVLAFSNGLLSSWAMMLGPERCTPEKRESAGTVMSACLVIGIFLGLMLAFVTQVGATASAAPRP